MLFNVCDLQLLCFIKRNIQNMTTSSKCKCIFSTILLPTSEKGHFQRAMRGIKIHPVCSVTDAI